MPAFFGVFAFATVFCVWVLRFAFCVLGGVRDAPRMGVGLTENHSRGVR